MGWSISNIDNTVQVTEECVAELFQWSEDTDGPWWDLEGVAYKGYLQFNIDHQEHMDYIRDPAVLAILLKHQVNGIITFGSLDGDNSGSFWGYQFDNGVLTRLVGAVTFSPVPK